MSLLDLEYFVASRQQPSCSFLLKMTDMIGIICIAQRPTFYFLWESINTMLSVLFVTEVCCTIKENNKKKIIFLRHVTILSTWITILLAKIEKSLFCVGIFFAGANYHFVDSPKRLLALRQLNPIHKVKKGTIK